MNVSDCIKMRRSIRKYKPDHIDHSIIDSIISIASYSPSWKNTQITRYIAIEDPSILKRSLMIIPLFTILILFVKFLCWLLLLLSKTDPVLNVTDPTAQKKGDRWQMFDVGVACQSFCLAAKEQGLGTVIMGIFDEEKITELLEIPPERELAALIAVGWPDDDPQAPKRKAVTDLLEYK